MTKNIISLLVILASVQLSFQNDTGWTTVTHGRYIQWDLENTPLQIRVNSEVGSDEQVYVVLYTQQEQSAGRVLLLFSSTPQYYLNYCTSSYQTLPKSLPGDKEKIFTIYRISAGVKIECNGDEIVNIVLSETCDYQYWQYYWTRDVEKIRFHSRDSASDSYRSLPGNVGAACFPEYIAGGYRVSLDDDDESGNERATYMCYQTFSMTPNKDMMARKKAGGSNLVTAYKALYGKGICAANDIRYLPECLDQKEAGHCGLPTEIENGNVLKFMLNEGEGEGDIKGAIMSENEKSDSTMPIMATYECKAGYKMYDTIHGNIGFCRKDGSMEIPSCEKNEDYMNVKFKLQNGKMKQLQGPHGKVFGGIVLSKSVDYEENDVGSWEYICNDGVNDYAAGAVCRSLGFKSGILIPASKKMMMDKHEFGWTRVSCEYDDTLFMSHNCEAMPYKDALEQMGLKEATCFKGLDIAAAMCFDDKWKFNIELKLYRKKMACLAQFQKQETRINLNEMGTVKVKFLLDDDEIETGDVKYKPKKGFFARVDVKDKEFNCASCEIYVGESLLDSTKSCREE